MGEMTASTAAAPDFDGFRGELLRAGDAGYDDARMVHNGLIDKRPALIARCRGTADIAAAIRYARAQGLEIAVKGGGHNVAGRATTEGGVMIDLSLMRAIEVDPATRIARAEGGVTWRELNDATHRHGLATTGGVISSTGIAGLTLGGGVGWLMAKFGLAVDNVIAIELVTAEGRVLTASDREEPDLFWGLRGGGGNFGVAASFTYRLHPLTQVVGGLVAHPLSAAGDVLRFYRDVTASLADDLSVFAGLVHSPDGSGVPLAALVVCHTGTAEQAAADLAPITGFGSPAMVQVGPMPYPEMNTLLDAGYPKGALNYWKSSFLAGLNEDLLDTLVDRFAACPSPMSGMVLEHVHGAVTRVGVTDTAVPHRDPGYNLVVTSEWLDPNATEANVAWTREVYAAIEPHRAGRRYVNYLGDDEASDAVREADGPNYDRLVEIKRRYDPDNAFRLNQNIPPA
jgi:FAD/FMN-containing dehydrogenase